ncbi:hypothetical protein [Nesterenkonia flava]|uniref:Uncharacterized protein n=1 Tax=Nesterenkonia flava TaxID=469799 RepID=A0ABU1FRW8_9MICC|nr:hypothetical protein [Nesterenkonia flava]MDR5711389.1 hypothetical protein [Nesterenkonia flava]
MTVSQVLPGQPYPDVHGWEDLASHLTNGWSIVDPHHEYLRGKIVGNDATIIGRLRIGTDRVISTQLPDRYRPYDGRTQSSPSATVRGVGPAEVEVWSDRRVVLPHNVLYPGSRAQTYQGETFVFTITYPRGTV